MGAAARTMHCRIHEFLDSWWRTRSGLVRAACPPYGSNAEAAARTVIIAERCMFVCAWKGHMYSSAIQYSPLRRDEFSEDLRS